MKLTERLLTTNLSNLVNGGREETRTPTGKDPIEPKSTLSANSSTRPKVRYNNMRRGGIEPPTA